MPSPRRAVIYARYSTDLQHQASIDDQVRTCRSYLEDDLKAELIKVYSDEAQSGASAFRPHYQRLLADAERGRFSILVCVSIDRLGRRLADVSDLHDRLSHRGIKIFTPSFGEITSLHIALHGLMAQEQLRSIAERTKAGLVGRVEQGKSAGGIGYGYRALPPQTIGKSTYAGEREIIPEEAAIVRRIFEEYADGVSPETIARRLNQEGIAGPTGGPWRNTTIRGQATRGNGLINNELYIGRLVYNRCSYVKDPKNGKRQARPNPPQQWIRHDVPQLRIVDDDLWARVKDRQAEITERTVSKGPRQGRKPGTDNNLNAAHRAKYLLSGLVKCASCGGSYTICGKDRYGCANRNRGTGMCTNTKTITRPQLEARILNGLRDRLLAPERVELAVKEANAAAKRAHAEARKGHHDLIRKRDKAKQALSRLLDLVETGQAPASLLERIGEREAELARLQAQLDAQDERPAVVELHPNFAAQYREKVANLVEAVNDPAIRDRALEILRGLIGNVVLHPDPSAPNGVALELRGVLSEIVQFGREKAPKNLTPAANGGGGQVSVVAGARNRLCRNNLSATETGHSGAGTP